MSIQRYNHEIDGLEPSAEGQYVLYTDHSVSLSDAFTEGMLAERARIRAAVEAIREAGDMPGVIAKSTVLSIIDGESTDDDGHCRQCGDRTDFHYPENGNVHCRYCGCVTPDPSPAPAG